MAKEVFGKANQDDSKYNFHYINSTLIHKHIKCVSLTLSAALICSVLAILHNEL
jgi:hypothetical protein